MSQILTGYKKTDIGVIPNDWCVLELGDVLKIRHGKSQKGYESSSGKNPILGTGGTLGRTNKSLHKGPSVLIGRKGTIDKPYYIDRPFWTVDTLFYSEIDPKYLAKFIYYKFLLIDWYSYNEASGVPSLSAKTIEKIEIGIPPLKEQQTIAKALSDIDTYISKLDALIIKQQQIKKGTMQQLLTGKKRLPGFDGQWEEVKLGEIFNVTRGYVLSFNKLYRNKSGVYKYPVYSSQTKNNGLSGYYTDYLYENAITWTTDGANAGDVNYRKGKFYCTNVCGVLLSNKGYANQCIAQIFGMNSKKYVSYVGNPKLMNNVVKEISVMIPKDIEEQNAISIIYEDLSNQIETLKDKKKKYENIKLGMMQKLLTGQIRLV